MSNPCLSTGTTLGKCTYRPLLRAELSHNNPKGWRVNSVDCVLSSDHETNTMLSVTLGSTNWGVDQHRGGTVDRKARRGPGRLTIPFLTEALYYPYTTCLSGTRFTGS